MTPYSLETIRFITLPILLIIPCYATASGFDLPLTCFHFIDTVDSMVPNITGALDTELTPPPHFFQQLLHMDYISLSWSEILELVVPIKMSLIEGCC
jgi:hypothetical protein